MAAPGFAPTLTGDGVGLRPWRAADAPDLLGACGDPEIADWSSFPFHPDPAKITAWLERQADPARKVSLAVVDPSHDVALGYCGLNGLDRGPEHVSMGYWLVSDARGRGLMRPAARLLAEWALGSAVATCITLLIKPGNTPSLRVAEHLGAVRIPGEELDRDRRGRAHRFVRFELRRYAASGT